MYPNQMVQVGHAPTAVVSHAPPVHPPVIISKSERFWWKRVHYRNWSCLCWIIVILVVISLIGLIVGLSVWAASEKDEKKKDPHHQPPPYPPMHPTTPPPHVYDTVAFKGKIVVTNWHANEIANNRDRYSRMFCDEMMRATEPFNPRDCQVVEFGYGSVVVTYHLELEANLARDHGDVYATINCAFGMYDMHYGDYLKIEIDRKRMEFIDRHGQFRTYSVCYDHMYAAMPNGYSNCRPQDYNRKAYECHCQQGYQLSVDRYSCVSVVSPADCPNGYYRDSYGVCQDVDECQNILVCPTHQMCYNSPGSYRCDVGDFTRMDCTADYYEHCNGYQNTRCVTAQNSQGYECVCLSGFYRTQSGNCMDVDECLQPNACAYGQSCVNRAGYYDCL